MAGSSSAPALVATFFFGLVVLAASAAIFFFVKANRSPLFRDELRLALVFFLATSALWGILEFAATLVSHSATSACQVAISFATIFDQLARFSVEQFLLWGVNGGMKVTKLSLVLQGALFLRFIIGAVFVGVQRPQFDPVCVASNLVLPIGIIVMVVDMAMTMALSTKAVLAKNGNALRPELSQSNTLIYVAVASGIWTGLSTPLFLGLKSTSLAVRTVMPAIGLLILIAIVALSAKNFVPLPSTSGLKIQKTVSFDSTTHFEIPTRNLPAQAFPSQNGMTRVPGALPLIRQPPSGQASEGIGGLPVEGELFPPMRAAQTAPVRPHHKKQMSDRAFNGGKIVISQPIVQVDKEETSNFDNIPTVDLATAAMKEKERREFRPAVDGILSKALSPSEIMGRSQSFNRKQVPQSAAPNNGRNLLSVEEPATAITSAVQLSPGIEETRRRSPRQVDRASPSPPIIPSKDEARTPKSAPLQSAPKVLVPPPKSTKRPPPIKSLQAKSPKESNAMPGVAISRFSVSTMDPMTARITSSMFSPQEKKLSKAAPPPPPAAPAPINQFWVDPRTASLPRSNSVKNNIRPSRQRPPSLPVEEEKKDTKTPLQRRATVGLPSNPRARATRIFTREQGATNERQIMFINNEEDTVPILAASEGEESHEEAESPSRKSMIHRPRPIPRKSTASASELLGVSFSPSQDDFTILSTPNLPLISPVSVKSLSRSEYGAPASSSPGSLVRYKSVRRTSFVPDLPAVPVEYQGQQPKITEEASVEASTTNVWTVVPNDQGFRMPNPDKTTQRALCISKFSVDTALTVEEPRSPYMSRLSINTQSSYEETIGRNSSVVFATEYKPNNRFSSLVNSFTERLTRHESVDSEFSMMLRNAPVPPKTAPGERRTVAQEDDEMTERPVVIDMSMAEPATSLGSNNRLTVKQLVSWHHRVGEELPSFSSQLKYRRSRKLMVPKPLALYKPANVTVVIEAEPSPIEPPQEALDKIHEQLKKFDIENGDARATISEQQRMTILANLESEMGAQESQWQMLRVDLAPGSPSTIVSSSGINSLRSSVDISKFEIMPITKLNGSAGDLLVALNEDASRRLSTSSDLSKEEMLESGDDKLNRRSLSASGRMSLLSVTNRTMSQIGSPTPPDTDESGEEDSDNDSMVEGLGSVKDMSTGLMPRSQASAVTSFLVLDEVLSSSSEDFQNKLSAPVEFEDVSLITPKAQPPSVEAQPEEPKAEIASPVEAETIRFSLADLEQPAPRPRSVTRRPPRQSKRISALPDIVENPEPIAGKTGTLGIFQFPWGEKSDSARVHPRMAGISGTMSSGRAWINPSVGSMNSIQEKQADYSPETPQTFLDDDELDNGLDNYEDEEYDDGFDEATLWEIASLLESDLDTSRDDLFMVDEESWEDQMPASDELSPAPTEVEDVSESAKEEVYDLIPVTLTSESSSDISSQAPALWTGNMKASRFLGLPQPSEGEWESYFAAVPRPARAVPRVMDEPAQLSSTSLWTSASTGASKHTTGLWCAPTAYRAEEKETKAASDVVSLVWSPRNLTKVSSLGLPQPDISVWNAYIPQAAHTVRRTTRMPEPALIETTSLWALRPAAKSSVSKGVWSSASRTEDKPSKIAVAALWLPLSLTRGTMMGLRQPETSVWNSYIPPATRAVRKTARMPVPAVIETTSLWALKSAAKPSVSNGVWSPAPKEDSREVTSLIAPIVVPSLWLLPSAARGNAWGLPQPDTQAWNSYMPSESRVARRTPQGQQQLAIRSAVMWSAEPLRTVEVISTKLWSLKTTTLLWAPSASKDAGVGLPQPDVQIWNTYIVSSTRSVRRNAIVLKSDTITSTSLWALLPVVVSQSGGVWKAKSLSVKPRNESSLKVVKDLLWSRSSTKVRSIGLPQPDANTWNMYLLPASRSYRKAYLPRPSMITSTSLWVPTLIAESPSGGVWKAKSQPSKSQATGSSQEVAFTVVRDLLWTPSSTKSLSLGLPQPDAESWSVYIVPAGRSHRGAYVPRLVTISSTSLWSPTLSTDAHLDGVWKPKSKQSPKKSTKAALASLWAQSPAAKPSFGLPQPVSEIWESYIPPMASSTFRRVLTSELASLESKALWSPSSKMQAARGYLWCPKQTQAEKKRPSTQSTTTPVAVRSPVSSNERTASVRKSMPVLMTQEQWNSAFKSISQEVQKDATPTNAPKARATRLNRSQSVKSRPVFDPSVMALISEYPALPKSLGRSKSISALPASRRANIKASSHTASASVSNVEPSQPATSAACLWTKLPLALPESSDKASMWQHPPRQKKRADVHPPSFVYSLRGPRRTSGRRIDLRHNITPPTSFRAGQGLWTGN